MPTISAFLFLISGGIFESINLMEQSIRIIYGGKTMKEHRWMTATEIRHALADISKSTLHRRTKELKLVERGYALRLGRRILFSNSLITDLPDLLKSVNTIEEDVGIVK
jgi:hypothetical protein